MLLALVLFMLTTPEQRQHAGEIARARTNNLITHREIVGGWAMEPCQKIEKDPYYAFQLDVWIRQQEQKVLNSTIWKGVECPQ